MILLAHFAGNEVCLRQGVFSAKKTDFIFWAEHEMAVELTRKSFTPYVAKKGEEYMNGHQRKHFRKILEALKSELSQEIDRTVHTMQDEATVFADPNDRASQESDMALGLRNRIARARLFRAGYLQLAYIMAASLQHVPRLARLRNRKVTPS